MLLVSFALLLTLESLSVQIIKFVQQTIPIGERVITAVDRGILELKTAIRNLHTQVESLQDKMDECVQPKALHSCCPSLTILR